MRYRGCEHDVSHTLSSYFSLGDFYTAAVADDTLVSDLLIFTTMTFPVLYRSEYLLAVKAVCLWFESPVVDRFRFCDFTVRPFIDDLIGRGQLDLQ